MHSSSQIFIIPRGTSRHVLSKLILLLTNQDNVSDSILKSSSKNKILEFDGTYFHRNTPENAKRENIRNENIIKSGYKVYHVSEFEYKQDKELVIQKCIEFINNNENRNKTI